MPSTPLRAKPARVGDPGWDDMGYPGRGGEIGSSGRRIIGPSVGMPWDDATKSFGILDRHTGGIPLGYLVIGSPPRAAVPHENGGETNTAAVRRAAGSSSACAPRATARDTGGHSFR